ncbi:SGNH/GDSL hydrolase family protein [Phytoactinopolyspora limicola]|uniref:SGNH/GDSL hydrolase family protein n=1 Tax=Phytoactinopolyspora limicola TaxID=2715536 RepID=UPI00140BF7A4|nr:SGNH/GDSL hydrolase family protein [Phytoactinopolyspora limicola]
MTMCRVVACGDSLTVGVGDPVPRSPSYPLGLRGWVTQLVESHPGIELVANLAQIGATARRVRYRQLPDVADHQPDVVTCAIGINDALSKTFDAGQFGDNYEAVIAELTRITTRRVVTVRLHDVAAGLPIREHRRAALRARLAAANDVIDQVSRKYGCWLVEVPVDRPLVKTRMLSADRLHPNGRGHRYLAARSAEVLATNGVGQAGAPATIPAPEPWLRRRRDDIRHLGWLGRHVLWPQVNQRWRTKATDSSPT